MLQAENPGLVAEKSIGSFYIPAEQEKLYRIIGFYTPTAVGGDANSSRGSTRVRTADAFPKYTLQLLVKKIFTIPLLLNSPVIIPETCIRILDQAY